MDIKQFEKICRMTQGEAKKYVAKKLAKTHGNVEVADGFVFARGTFPVLLVAHLDTVHAQVPRKIVYDRFNNRMSSPQGIGGDDRCGIYMILEIVKKYHCSVLFCEDEEVGGIGADKFIESAFPRDLSVNYIVELDRKGSNDAVFYRCGNDDFEDFVCTEHFKTNWGTFSDISVIAPFMGVAAVNLSCGYYNAHTTNEYVALDEMDANIKHVCNILERTPDKVFEYVAVVYTSMYESAYGSAYNYDGYGNTGHGSTGYSTAYDAYEDDDTDYWMIEYTDIDGVTQWDYVWARTDDEAVGKFMCKHPFITYNDITDMCAYNYAESTGAR